MLARQVREFSEQPVPDDYSRQVGQRHVVSTWPEDARCVEVPCRGSEWIVDQRSGAGRSMWVWEA